MNISRSDLKNLPFTAYSEWILEHVEDTVQAITEGLPVPGTHVTLNAKGARVCNKTRAKDSKLHEGDTATIVGYRNKNNEFYSIYVAFTDYVVIDGNVKLYSSAGVNIDWLNLDGKPLSAKPE